MQRPTRALIFLTAGVAAFLVITALLYQLGMARLEGRRTSFWQSIEWASETLSTTGYGADAPWKHPVMILLVVFVQFAGVFLMYLIIPLVLLPFLAERFEQKVPRRPRENLAGHVVIYRFGAPVETLLQRLSAEGVPSLVVELDERRARSVLERGQDVVFTREEENALDVCRIGSARAIIANGTDQESAALILRARQMGFAGEIYALVEDPSHRKPMELAGATAVYTPRHIIAAALAAHASDLLSPRLPGLDAIEGVARREIRVPAGSPLAGRTLRQAAVPAAIVGVWRRSSLDARCTADAAIEAGDVLEVVGTPAALEETAGVIGGTLLRNSGPFLIAGFGEVGRKVHELLRDVGEEVRVIERNAQPVVDVAGDVLDYSVLERAGLRTARALILALDSDDSTLFATVIARDYADDVPIIARVNHSRNLDNIHRAGADYALSIADVSGQMLSTRLLRRHARVREEHRRVVSIDGGSCAGRTLAEVCAEGRTLLALESSGRLLERVDPARTIEKTDRLWVCAL